MMVLGIKNEETLLGPLVRSSSCCSQITSSPPMPLPSTTPTRSGSNPASCRPLSSHACAAATIAIWVNRAMRFASRLLIYGSGVKSFTCPAAKICVCSAENNSGALMPLLPATPAKKLSRAVMPSGETAPMPVMYTLISYPPCEKNKKSIRPLLPYHYSQSNYSESVPTTSPCRRLRRAPAL